MASAHVPKNLHAVWLACHFHRRLQKKDIQDADIEAAVTSILTFAQQTSLRISGGLLSGITHIYWRKLDYFWGQCQYMLERLKHTNFKQPNRIVKRKQQKIDTPIEDDDDDGDDDLYQKFIERLEAAKNGPPAILPPIEVEKANKRRTPIPRAAALADLFGIQSLNNNALPPVQEDVEQVMENQVKHTLERWFAPAETDSAESLYADLGISVIEHVESPAVSSLADSGGPAIDVFRGHLGGEDVVTPNHLVEMMTARRDNHLKDPDSDLIHTAEIRSSAARSLLEEKTPLETSPRFGLEDVADDSMDDEDDHLLKKTTENNRLSLLSLSSNDIGSPPAGAALSLAAMSTEAPTSSIEEDHSSIQKNNIQLLPTKTLMTDEEIAEVRGNTRPLRRLPSSYLYKVPLNFPGALSRGVLDLHNGNKDFASPSYWAEPGSPPYIALHNVSQHIGQQVSPQTKKRKRNTEKSDLEELSAEAVSQLTVPIADLVNQKKLLLYCPLQGILAKAHAHQLKKHAIKKLEWAVTCRISENGLKRRANNARSKRPESTTPATRVRTRKHDDGYQSDTVVLIEQDASSLEGVVDDGASMGLPSSLDEVDHLSQDESQCHPYENCTPCNKLVMVEREDQSMENADAFEVFSIIRDNYNDSSFEDSSFIGVTPKRGGDHDGISRYNTPSTHTTPLLEVKDCTPIRPPGAELCRSSAKSTRRRIVTPLGILLRNKKKKGLEILQKEADFSDRTIRVIVCLSGRMSRSNVRCISSAKFDNTETPEDLVPVVSFSELTASQPRDVAACLFLEVLTLRSRKFLEFALVDCPSGTVGRGDQDLLLTTGSRYEELASTLEEPFY